MYIVSKFLLPYGFMLTKQQKTISTFSKFTIPLITLVEGIPGTISLSTICVFFPHGR